MEINMEQVIDFEIGYMEAHSMLCDNTYISTLDCLYSAKGKYSIVYESEFKDGATQAVSDWKELGE